MSVFALDLWIQLWTNVGSNIPFPFNIDHQDHETEKPHTDTIAQ